MRFKLNNDKSKCWWCGSNDLSGEHKIKKSDLELLYGKVYSKGNLINHIKYKTETNGKNIQSSTSDRVKFEKNICKHCNSARSQKFDVAYQRFMSYYYQNRIQIKESHIIDLKDIFGNLWKEEYLNVKRYIGKHVGCRMAETGLLPSKNLIAFLNNEEDNNDLKIIFQLKPYTIGNIEDSIELIFLGPANPINNSIFKLKNWATSFSGWYSIANLTWNYLHEIGISNRNRTTISQYIHLQVVNYERIRDMKFPVAEETLMKDFGHLLDELEYYPYNEGTDKNIEHYKYMRNISIEH